MTELQLWSIQSIAAILATMAFRGRFGVGVIVAGSPGRCLGWCPLSRWDQGFCVACAPCATCAPKGHRIPDRGATPGTEMVNRSRSEGTPYQAAPGLSGSQRDEKFILIQYSKTSCDFVTSVGSKQPTEATPRVRHPERYGVPLERGDRGR